MHRFILSVLFLGFAGSAGASCYADYKAKQDDPLRLAYGVAEITGPCTVADARSELTARLGQAGWTLLTVIGTFDETGLEERRDSAADHYLSY